MIHQILDLSNKALMRFSPVARRRLQNKLLYEGLSGHPDLLRPVNECAEKRFVDLWRRLSPKVNVDWFRYYCNVSGVVDETYVPLDIYFAFIEPVLNDYVRRDLECEDKNEFDIFVDNKYTSDVVLRYVRGMFMDADFNVVEFRLDHDIGELIGKPAGTACGRGIEKFGFVNGGYVSLKTGVKLTREYVASHDSYVLEKVIQQHEFTAQFNASSANTFRMVTLRCPWNGEVKLIKTMLRIGVEGGAVDNLSAGGICVSVDDSGRLADVGRTWVLGGSHRYECFTEHPTSHVVFKGLQHPLFSKMKECVINCAKRIPYANILGWDAIATNDGKVKLFEVNANNLLMDAPQYDFGSLFGEDTRNVIDWCLEHRAFMRYQHVRM